MPNCTNPTCGSSGAYIGLFNVECPNPKCIHFRPNLSETALKRESAPFADQPFAEAMRLRGVPVDLGKMNQQATCITDPKRKKKTFQQIESVSALTTPGGVVHPFWRQAGIYKRWVTTNPNLHALNHTLMDGIQTQKYYFKFMEMYIYAHLAGIPEIITWYDMGKDVYSELSALSLVDRASMKEAWWAVVYNLPTRLWKHSHTQAGMSFLNHRYPQIRHLKNQLGSVANSLQTEVGRETNKVGEALHNAGLCVRGVWHDTILLTDAPDEEVRTIMCDNASYKFKIEEG